MRLTEVLNLVEYSYYRFLFFWRLVLRIQTRCLHPQIYAKLFLHLPFCAILMAASHLLHLTSMVFWPPRQLGAGGPLCRTSTHITFSLCAQSIVFFLSQVLCLTGRTSLGVDATANGVFELLRRTVLVTFAGTFAHVLSGNSFPLSNPTQYFSGYTCYGREDANLPARSPLPPPPLEEYINLSFQRYPYLKGDRLDYDM